MKNTKAKNPFNPNQVKNKNPKSDSSDLSNTQGNAHLLHSFKTPSSKARVLSSNCTERGSRWGTLSSVREVMLETGAWKLRAKLFCWGRTGAQRQEGRSEPVLQVVRCSARDFCSLPTLEAPGRVEAALFTAACCRASCNYRSN